MICGPEIARIVNEFQENIPNQIGSNATYLHHGQTKSFQDKFHQHISLVFMHISLVSMMEEFGKVVPGKKMRL